jgi:hypothetical protein
MEHDDRDRRDWPQEEGDGPSEDPGAAGAAEEPTEPTQSTEPSQPYSSVESEEPVEPTKPIADARAEIEAWPSQDASAPDETAEQASPDAGSGWGDEKAPESAWPTEPPAAGSAADDSWPTTPPARGEEPILEPRAEEPVPSEVEAYPAAAATDAAPIPETAAAHAVPAAESATGESTQCPRCGTENRPGLAFCRNCGQRLVAAGVASTVERPGVPEGTQACARCGTHNRSGVAFCQNCGANLRGTAPGYVPPAVAEEGGDAAEVERRGAILGPIVLLIGLVGIITAYLLPFAYGAGSLFDRAYGADGYGIAFWNGYPDVNATLADQAYFGLAAPAPLFGLLLLALAVAGFVRAAPGMLQRIGLGIALLWSVGLIVLFVVVELAASWSGDIVALLRDLSPAGIIFFLAALIVLIGTLTRFGRS